MSKETPAESLEELTKRARAQYDKDMRDAAREGPLLEPSETSIARVVGRANEALRREGLDFSSSDLSEQKQREILATDNSAKVSWSKLKEQIALVAIPLTSIPVPGAAATGFRKGSMLTVGSGAALEEPSSELLWAPIERRVLSDLSSQLVFKWSGKDDPVEPEVDFRKNGDPAVLRKIVFSAEDRWIGLRVPELPEECTLEIASAHSSLLVVNAVTNN